MSGIALVLHLDGQPAAASDLAPMLAQMARRGPDGEDVVVAGHVALGHRHLPTTPEALVEAMPLSDPLSGCILTGDIRLDNRDELLLAFDLSQPGIGDGALVLRAWERWGEDCATRLLGDFAFAIWDPRRQTVFGARDQMGMRQLIYGHRPNHVFACATSANAVARQSRLRPEINDLRIAEALIGFEYGSLTSTLFDGVYRLPPGHCFTVSDKGIAVRAYWEMEPSEPLRLSSDGEYAEAFREVLSMAVRARLRGATPVGSMLSGGMDSGSIVALACRMLPDPLQTFSSVGTAPATCIETRAIHAALSLPNLAPTLIGLDEVDAWKDDLIDAWRAMEEPWDLHMTLPRTAYLAASRAGVNVVLDGVAGDTLLDHGSQMVRDLRAGRFLRAYQDARGLATFEGVGLGDIASQLVTAARGAFMPETLRRLRAAWRGDRPPPLPSDSAVDPGFADRVGLRDVLRDWQRNDQSWRMSFPKERAQDWPRSGLTVGRERYDRVAGHFGVEPRDPFMDKRLWEFCLSLPIEQFQAGGWPKIVMRRSMEGLLPDEVRWRLGKQHLGSAFSQRLVDHWSDWKAPIRGAKAALSGKTSVAALDFATLGGGQSEDRQFQIENLLQTSISVGNISAEQGIPPIDNQPC